MTARTPARRPVVQQPWIDPVRVVVIGAVIAVHAATAYVVPISWYYQERTTSTWTPVLTSGVVELLAAFGLAPLFLVAGLLAAGSLGRRGPGRYAAARLLRLGLPAVFYVLLVDPMLRWWVASGQGDDRPLLAWLTDWTGGRGLGPMWFVVALLGFSLIYAGWRRLRPVGPSRPSELSMSRLLTLAAGIAALDLLTWPRVPDTVARYWDFEWPHWQAAAGVFVLGVLAGERGWFRAPSRLLLRVCGCLSLVALTGLAGLAALSVQPGNTEIPPGSWQVVIMAGLDGLTVVLAMVWLVDRLQRHQVGRSPLLAVGARSSYGAYLVHPVVLVGLSLALRSATWAPEAKLVVVVAIGVPVSFLIGGLGNRLAAPVRAGSGTHRPRAGRRPASTGGRGHALLPGDGPGAGAALGSGSSKSSPKKWLSGRSGPNALWLAGCDGQDSTMTTYPIVVRESAPHYAATRTATLAVTELPGWLGQTYRQVAMSLGTHRQYPADGPFARYHRLPDGRFQVTAGFPVAERPVGDGDVIAEWVPGSRVAVLQYAGDYGSMEPAYRALSEWLSTHDAVAVGDPYEVYRSDPQSDPNPATRRTDIVQPFVPAASSAADRN